MLDYAKCASPGVPTGSGSLLHHRRYLCYWPVLAYMQFPVFIEGLGYPAAGAQPRTEQGIRNPLEVVSRQASSFSEYAMLL